MSATGAAESIVVRTIDARKLFLGGAGRERDECATIADGHDQMPKKAA